MAFDDICGTNLVLGLGSSSAANQKSRKLSTSLGFDKGFEPSLTLSLSGDQTTCYQQAAASREVSVIKSSSDNQLCDDLYRQDSVAASSYSNGSVKRERDHVGSEETEIEKISSRGSDEDEDGSNGRKKLRLNKAQSALLEESFKLHSTLNPKQKQDLARDLNLRPRQVEVWFQNRRARTKLKQTEVDCEFLKKCCETLTDENMKLHKELQELKALKLAQPSLYMSATLTMCPSCERIGENSSKNPFSTTMAQKPHYYTPFTNPSAAC